MTRSSSLSHLLTLENPRSVLSGECHPLQHEGKTQTAQNLFFEKKISKRRKIAITFAKKRKIAELSMYLVEDR